MLKKEEFENIGYVARTHGISGELACKLDIELGSLFEAEANLFLMLEVHDLLIPYRVVGHRTKGVDIDLILFADISTKEEAESLLGYSIWISRTYLGENIFSEDPLDFLRYVGYSLFHAKDERYIGEIVDVDDNTMNVLLFIEKETGEELVVPIAEELMAGYDDTKQTLHLHIPEGLLDNNVEYAD